LSPEAPRVDRNGLRVDPAIADFIENELLPAIDREPAPFWAGFAALIADLTPANGALLARRDALQAAIDEWHRAHPAPWDHDAYVGFLHSIGYLGQPGAPFTIETANVDPEIAEIAGPQLVVPVDNARFAINACNARWGSLYDALYGTDVIDGTEGRERGTDYNPRRGDAVIERAAGFLDEALPLEGARHRDVLAWRVDGNAPAGVRAELAGKRQTTLVDPLQFSGYARDGDALSLLFRRHGLYIELRIDPAHPIGGNARAHLADVLLESALTTIQDCEDSVAAVDAADKLGVYRNWLGLMRGDLEALLVKDGRSLTRTLAPDRNYVAPDGSAFSLPGRSLMLVRNVGHHMQTDAILDREGEDLFEGFLDAVVTAAAAMANRARPGRLPNSRFGSIYIVKPKLHGPEEVQFTTTLFSRVEDLLGLPPLCLKIGVMDEERRTTVNLPACLDAVRARVVFINTGFLDRTGDEIHTGMHAGPVLPKEAIKTEPWIRAYEDWNVDIGIRCGLPGRGQIGKGMWAKPDEMRDMLASKEAQLQAGASCAWVPSPTAATLHAMHYHRVDVRARQAELAERPLASLDDILTPPVAVHFALSADAIRAELENNLQGILGYVVRWVGQGIGCSKVPDVHDVGLMEDRATLRISSQHVANWLLHGVVDAGEVEETLRRMAAIVDEQNVDDPAYCRMSADFDASFAFQAARELVFRGREQPNGYTEWILHAWRRRAKARVRAV
jgi:malate synthase